MGRNLIRRLLTALLALLIPMLALAPQAMASGLGISVSFERSGETDAEASGRIWGGGEAGTAIERVMIIDSLSDDTEQQISFEVYDQVTENEETSIDFTKPSRITDWVVFEPATPVLQPGEQLSVKITFNIPSGTDDGAFNASIRTLSSAADSSVELDPDAGTQAVIGTRIAIDTKVWLGVGDALTLAPSFEIIGVDGALIGDEKFVRVFFENTGISPIQPSGRFQLSDPNFVDRIFEPVDFQMREITGGQIGFTDIPVPLDVEDGLFRAFVTAQEAEVRITRLFEAQLVFDDPNKLSIPDLAIRIAAFVVAAIGLVIGVRLIRGNSSKAPGKPKVQKGSRPQGERTFGQLLRLKRRPSAAKAEDQIEVLQAMVAKMEQRLQELNRELPTTAKPKTVANPRPPVKPRATKASTTSASAKKPVIKKTATTNNATKAAPNKLPVAKPAPKTPPKM